MLSAIFGIQGPLERNLPPPKMCSKMPFSPLEKKNLRCFSAFLPNMFFLKISVSKRCLSLTAVKASLRFTPRGFPPFLGCGFPRPEGIASILIRFTPSPGPSWLFGTSDLGRTELRWWDVFFGRWKLVVFSESLKKVGGFMVGQPTPPLMYPSRKKALLYTPLCLEGGRQEGVGWLAIMNFSGLCWWNPKSFLVFQLKQIFELVDIFINWFPTRKHGEWMQFFHPLGISRKAWAEKTILFRSCQATNDTLFELKGRLEETTGFLRHSPNPNWSCHQQHILVVPSGIPSQSGRSGFCISTVLTFAGGVSLKKWSLGWESWPRSNGGRLSPKKVLFNQVPCEPILSLSTCRRKRNIFQSIQLLVFRGFV